MTIHNSRVSLASRLLPRTIPRPSSKVIGIANEGYATTSINHRNPEKPGISPATACTSRTSAFRRSPASAANTAAFTLLELLVSMLILVIMMLAIVGLVSDSSRAMHLGYEQSYMDANLRAVFDTLMDDLNQAVVSVNMPFCRYESPSDAAKETYDSSMKCNSIIFSALTGGKEGGCADSIQTVKWCVKKSADADYWSIYRGVACGADINPSDVNAYPLIDHVVEFQIRTFTVARNGDDLTTTSISAEELSVLPDFVEIYILLVSDTIHVQAMRMSGAARLKHLRLHGKRHFFKAIFPMGVGRTALYDYTQP